jgi:hypothetical protein
VPGISCGIVTPPVTIRQDLGRPTVVLGISGGIVMPPLTIRQDFGRRLVLTLSVGSWRSPS